MPEITPPALLLRTLRRVLPKYVDDSALGDFEEEYNAIVVNRSFFFAILWFFYQILKSLPAFILESLRWGMVMFKNFLNLAIRNALKNRVFSLINITGLAIGIACFLLIFLFLRYERGYDRFHEKSDLIYRVIKECGYPGGTELRADAGVPMAPLLRQNFPEITNSVRFATWYESLIGYGDKVFSEQNFYFVDSSVFEVFSYPLSKGDEDRALIDPFSVVISSSMAEKYFGDEDPVGKVITCRFSFRKEAIDLKITGVLQKIPKNTHMQYDFFASFETLRNIVNTYYMTDRWDSPVYTYVTLAQDRTAKDLEEGLDAVAKEYVGKSGYTSIGLRLQPLKDIYFKSQGIGGGIWKTGNLQASYGFMALAVFILLIACVNFMNLSTARSSQRAREVGMRKVLGAQRSSLIFQFLGESMFFCFLGLIFALLLVKLLLPMFMVLTQTELSLDLPNDLTLLLTLLLTVVLVGLIAGSYPALILSAFRPVKILKGVFAAGSSDLFRKALVVFQFGITAVLIIGSVVVFRQLTYLKHKDIGFDKEHVIFIPFQEISAHEKYDLLKNQLLRNPDIFGVTAVSTVPGIGSQNGIKLKTEDIDELDMGIIYVDYDFVETLGIEVKEGRHFDTNLTSDAKSAFLVNESFLQKVGWDSAVGRDLELFYKRGETVHSMYSGSIIGVVKNFNFREIHMLVQPVVFNIDPGRFEYMLVRINGQNRERALTATSRTFKELVPAHPFEFSFLDLAIEDAYQREKTFGRLINYATILAIFVACLGLFGLTSFAAQRRTKEIGIRKTLGASVPRIVLLLTKDFIKLIAIANVIAWPVGYFLMNDWLQNYAFRTSVGWFTFILAGLITLAIALLAISYQAIKAAMANPVDSLKYE